MLTLRTTRILVFGAGASLGLVLGLSSLRTGEATGGVTCRGLAATIVGTDGPDVITGTEGPDVIVAAGGDDRVIGGGGDDLICGGEGDDHLWGGGGNDSIDAEAGDDLIFGDAGIDQLWGGDGVDQADGGGDGGLCDAEIVTACGPGGPSPSPAAAPLAVTPPTSTIAPAPGPLPAPGLGASGSIDLPGPATAGVPAGTVLRQVAGPLTITKPGTKLVGLDIAGCVRIKADYVVIRSTRIRCDGANAAVWQTTGNSGLVIEHSEISGVGAAPTGAGVWTSPGDGFTMRGTEISHVGDGVFVGTGTVIEGNWIHDLTDVPGVHHDLIQMVGGSDVIIRTNRLEHRKAQTSAVMIKADLAAIRNVEISGNHLSGGAFTVYVMGGAHGSPKGVEVTGNTIVANSYVYGPMVVEGSTTPSCNRLENGQPINVARSDGAKGTYLNPC